MKIPEGTNVERACAVSKGGSQISRNGREKSSSDRTQKSRGGAGGAVSSPFSHLSRLCGSFLCPTPGWLCPPKPLAQPCLCPAGLGCQ